ncbi:MFS transporter [Oceaniradius stylonematis]|uniref:MFS transporter n=1 Tax=Oceaniradius stylonematis TaxID=2184161 RepID=UPI0035CE9421
MSTRRRRANSARASISPPGVLATKLSLALAVGLAFPLLDLFGFEAGAGPAQDPGALSALAVTYALVPVALKSGAIALMWNFPLDETRQSELRASIERE